MGSAEITIVAFGSLSMVATAVGLLLKDLVFGGRQTATKRSLRRVQNVYDRPDNRTFLGRVDSGFDRLIIESGVEIAPATGFLILFASALVFGGAIAVYTNQPLYGIGGGILGMILPLFVFAAKRKKRFGEIRRQLPGMIDMLARSTRAGRSVEQAISIAAEETNGIISEELNRLNQSLSVGSSFDRAIKVFARRLPLIEVRILATTLMVQRQSGGHLSETLERMAKVVRDRLAILGQIQATTGAGRMSTIIIATLAPAAFLFIMMVNPDHIEILLNDTAGRALLLIGVMLEFVGLLWVFMLMRNDA